MGRGYVFTGQICHQIIFCRQQLMYWPTYSLGNLCHQMLRSMPSGAIVLGPGFRMCSPLVIDSQFCTCTRTMAWSQIVLAIVKLNNCNCICTLTWIQIMPTACYWFIIVLVLELYLYLAYGTILQVWSQMFLHSKVYWQFLMQLHLHLDLDLSLKLIYIRGGA